MEPANTFTALANESLRERCLRDDEGAVTGGVIVCHDVTGRKRAESRRDAQYEVSRVLAESGPLESSAHGRFA